MTARNFAAVMQCWEDNCEKFYKEEESKLISILRQYFNNELDKIDGRTMAAIFRRFDVLIEYLK